MPVKLRKCKTCPSMTRYAQCRPCYNAKLTAARPEVQVAADLERKRIDHQIRELSKKYDESLKTIERLKETTKALDAIGQGLETFQIEPKLSSKSSEATAVMVASDWHCEENVGNEVGGLNTFNVGICGKRATRFFTAGLRLIKLLQQDVTIDTVVLALLGDFITNDIHDAENAEVNELLPIHAIVQAQNFLVSGIQFLLDNSKANLVIPCHSGNHARTTHRTRFTTENGHSLEYLMYLHLAAYFRAEDRVEFIIPDGPHSYVRIYDQTIRFHHGHMIKYQGGIGGIFIPAYKAIAQWNKACRGDRPVPDLDVFGHFHQCKDGGNFLCNGSLIGYNAFALSIKADYEPPKQQLFLIDKKRGRTCTWPILVSSSKD